MVMYGVTFLLKRYEFTEEGFIKRRYKNCRPDSGETFQQFTGRMKCNLTRWIYISGINKTFCSVFFVSKGDLFDVYMMD